MDNFELAKKYFFEGVDFLEKSLFQEAEDKFLESLKLVPDRASTLTNLAATQIKLKKYSEAKQHSENSMELEKDNPETFMNLGLIANESKDYKCALEYFSKATLLNPDQNLAWLNKGSALHELRRYEEALASYDKALSLNNEQHEVWSNRGNTLYELRRYEEALASYDKALSLNNEQHEVWSNRGNTLIQQKRYKEALAAYEKSIKIKPEYANAIYNLGLGQLLTGDLRNGWGNYENRWLRDESEPYQHREITRLKNLEELNQKRVLVWSEQGFGDTIQFSRYVKGLTSLGGKIIFEVQPSLRQLIEQSFLNCEVIAKGDPFGKIDFQVPLLSLPSLFNTELTSIPNDVPYLKIEESGFIRLKSHSNLETKKLNIGIAFSGNPSHKNDFNRSMDLSLLKPLINIGNIFVIQKGIQKVDRLFLNNHPEIQYLGNQMHTFTDTANYVKQMDIIVSVDTSLAHLAGALGLPTYTLLPWAPDWRWLLDREDSPWYPSMEVLRQPSRGDWQSVVENLVARITSEYLRC